MLEFIKILIQRYQAVSDQVKNDTIKSVYQHRIDQQILAEAFIKKRDLLKNHPNHPLHLVVIGPTQAGKSSLVNLLLDSNEATVSPLAGYTVHSQGFCNGLPISDCEGLQSFFGRFQQLSASQLNKERLDSYGLSVNSGNSDLLPECVLWDTPDFDSIDAEGYSEALIRTIALADMIILIVSKEKYADQSVWELMTSIQALQQPTLICVNKLVEGSESIVLQSLKQKWEQSRSDEFPSVIPLLYQKQLGKPVWPESEKSVMLSLTRRVNRKLIPQYIQDYINQYWYEWLEPVVGEHKALNEWNQMVDDFVNQAIKQYKRDYLDHPHHYETFQNAMASLLNLLEIPGLAKVLAGTRKVITWPMRQLFRVGSRKPRLAENSHEIALLNHLAEHLLIQLSDNLLATNERDMNNLWWKNIMKALRNERQKILDEFDVAATAYHEQFQVEVDQAAHRLYNKLQEQPLVLNSLRATRVTTDAAAVALSLQLGGIGLHDLIVTPAMLSVTSLLTESAIGSYVNKVEAELKQRQLATVKQNLIIEILQQRLYQLPEYLTQNIHFNISPEQVQAAEQQLKQIPHGLRLL